MEIEKIKKFREELREIKAMELLDDNIINEIIKLKSLIEDLLKISSIGKREITLKKDDKN